MPLFNNVLAGAAGSGGDAGYKVERSLRFNSSDGAYLSRNFSAGNRKVWTWSGWFKLTKLGRRNYIFTNWNSGGQASLYLEWTNSNKIRVGEYNSSWEWLVESAAVFRDISAWQNLVVSVDTSSGTASFRVKVFLNGVQLNAFDTSNYPAQHRDTYINQAVEHNIGRLQTSAADFYLADVHFLDGIAVSDPDGVFGEYSNTGVWNPIEYTHAAPVSTSAITNVSSVDNTRTISVTAAGWQQLNNAVDSSDSSVSPSNNNNPGTITFSPALVGVTKVRAKTRFYGGGTAKLYDGTTELHSVNHNNNNATQYYTIYEGPPIQITQYWQQMNAYNASDDFWALEVNNTIVATNTNGGNLSSSISGAAITLTTTDNSNYSSFSAGKGVDNGAQISAINSSTPSITVDSGSWNTGDTITLANNSFHLNFSDNSSNAALGTDNSPHGNNWTVNNLTAAAATANISQTWSSTSNNYHSGAGSAFDGNLTTSAFASGGNNANAYVDITAINASKVEVYISAYGSSSAGGYYYCRQTDNTQHTYTISSSGTSLGWVTVYEGSQISINRLGGARNSSGAAGSAQYAWRVDGVLLVDNGTTGFDPTGIDSLLDSPTNYDNGTSIGGNYATLNPLDSNSATLTNGNLEAQVDSGGANFVRGTIAVSSGKWYWEYTVLQSNNMALGVVDVTGTGNLSDGGSFYYYVNGGTLFGQSSGKASSYGSSTLAVGDTLGVALDMDAGTLKLYKNGSYLNNTPAWTGLTGRTLAPAIGTGGGNNNRTAFNAGQRPFAHPVSGYKPLCTQSLDDPLIADPSTAFDVALWTGNGSSAQTISTPNLSPDMVWYKERSSTSSHGIVDSVRGATNAAKVIYPDRTDQEATGNATQSITSLNSNGFTIGSSDNSINQSSQSYVGWAWEGGDLATNSAYNQSDVWSSRCTGTIYNASLGYSNAFDGSTSTGSHSANGNSITFTPASAISVSSSIKIYYDIGSITGTSGSADITINGTSYVATAHSNRSNGHFTVTGVSSITSMVWERAADNDLIAVKAIEVDGKMLVDAGVIPVGSLNSSAYDSSQTWSSFGSSGTYSSTYDWTKMFAGDMANARTIPANNNSITADFSSLSGGGIAYTSSFRLYYNRNSSAPDVKVNGSGINATADGTDRVYELIGSGLITSVGTAQRTVLGNGDCSLKKIEIDGVVLLDNGVTPVDNFPSILTTCRANQTAGFSIVSYTGNSVAGSKIAHSLNAEPSLVFLKNRDRSINWAVGQLDANSFVDGDLNLNTTNAKGTGYIGFFGASPTSSVFTVNNNYESNYANEDYIAFCFSPVAGYSQFTTHTVVSGTNFVYLGFRPRFVMLKRTGSGTTTNMGFASWAMFDTRRDTFNEVDFDTILYANVNHAEGKRGDGNATTGGTYLNIDILSNGIRFQSGAAEFSQPSDEIIVMAWAEHPLKYARAR